MNTFLAVGGNAAHILLWADVPQEEIPVWIKFLSAPSP
jgi:hypothetical protein